MKRFLLLGLSLLVVISICVLCFVSCSSSNSHKHKFDRQVADEEYLNTPATCQKPATYFYSCECGEKGTETFEYGEKPEHSFAYGGICTVCGYDTSFLKFTLQDDITYSVSVENPDNVPSSVNIPSLYDGKTVTTIGKDAFLGCKSLTSITIPEGVTIIKEQAFKDSSSLISITITNSVNTIESYAFEGCSSLKNIHISSIESWCKINFKSSFSNIESLHDLYLNHELVTNAVVPETVKFIDSYMFNRCKSLTTLIVSEGVNFIDSEAFSDCTSLTNISLPNSLTSFRYSTISDCTNLKYNEYDNALYLGNEDNPYLVLVKAKSKDINS